MRGGEEGWGGGGTELPTLEWVSQQPMCVRVCACIVNVN